MKYTTFKWILLCTYITSFFWLAITLSYPPGAIKILEIRIAILHIILIGMGHLSIEILFYVKALQEVVEHNDRKNHKKGG